LNHVVALDEKGHLIYDGLLSSQEKASIDQILKALKTEIPQIESDLEAVYGKAVLYKYNLGLVLGELLNKYKISNIERRRFWDEIKRFASKENRKRNEGKNAATRSFYEQCFVLSQYNKNVVQKLSWRQWQDILDRVGNREDSRLFDWIEQKKEKIREDDWREFEKALHTYLKSKDTSVFSTSELFSIYDSMLQMAMYWRMALSLFSKNNPKSAKIKTKSKRSKKYQSACFSLKRERRCALDEILFKEAFEIAMS
jgi:hypothetical protein